MSTLYLPLAVRGLGTGLDTVLPAVLGSSISTSLALLGGREVKGLSGAPPVTPPVIAPVIAPDDSSDCSEEILSDITVLGASDVARLPRAGLGLGLSSSGSVARPDDIIIIRNIR